MRLAILSINIEDENVHGGIFATKYDATASATRPGYR
jgi:hypothetical protein